MIYKSLIKWYAKQCLWFKSLMPSVTLLKVFKLLLWLPPQAKCKFIHEHLFGGGGKMSTATNYGFLSDQYTLLWIHITRSNTFNELSVMPLSIPCQKLQPYNESLWCGQLLYHPNHRNHEEKCNEEHRSDICRYCKIFFCNAKYFAKLCLVIFMLVTKILLHLTTESFFDQKGLVRDSLKCSLYLCEFLLQFHHTRSWQCHSVKNHQTHTYTLSCSGQWFSDHPCLWTEKAFG